MGNCLGKISTIARRNIAEEASDAAELEWEGTGTGEIVTPNLKVFGLDELKSATRNFRPDTVLGEGGFGRVFKGWIDRSTLKPSRIGVKRSNPDSRQGWEEWQSEVELLGKFCHPNLVKLIGYCMEENQLMLVYEYMQKGSLENHLFGRGPEPLAWDIRLKIAIGAARGLAFLHASEKSVIYRDFKSSNILLAGWGVQCEAFGLRAGKAWPRQRHVPHNHQGHGNLRLCRPRVHSHRKSDVYGFGVVLLEILTGLVALDPNRPSGEHNLVDWKRPYLGDKKKLRTIVDPKLGHNYSLAAAFPYAASFSAV